MQALLHYSQLVWNNYDKKNLNSDSYEGISLAHVGFLPIWIFKTRINW